MEFLLEKAKESIARMDENQDNEVEIFEGVEW